MEIQFTVTIKTAEPLEDILKVGENLADTQNMERKLYYSVDTETDSKEIAVFKHVKCYEIDNGNLKKVTEINDLWITEDEKVEIQDYLNDNGYNAEAFKLIRL